jgi:hypothetical protein
MAISPPVPAALASSIVSRAMLPPLSVAVVAAGISFAIVKSFLQGLVDLPLTDLAFAKRFRICAPVRYWESKSPRHSIFLGLLDLPQLLLPLLALLRCNLLRRLVRITSLSIPIQIFALLPASNRGHERVAEIVFALRIVLHIFPFEVDAATRAFLADRLKEIHGGYKSPSAADATLRMLNGWSTGTL